MVDKIVQACDGSVAGKTIAVLGITFKPNTDDVRESPSLVIVPGLMARGGNDSGLRSRRHAGGPARSRQRRLVPGTPTMRWMVPMRWSSSLSGNEFRALDLDRARGAAQDTAAGRPPQYLRAERGGRRGHSLCERRPARNLSMSKGHPLDPAILGAYDIRGIVGETLTEGRHGRHRPRLRHHRAAPWSHRSAAAHLRRARRPAQLAGP